MMGRSPASAIPELREAARHRREGRLDQAEAESRRAVRANPFSAEACHELATILHQQGKKAEALELMKRAAALAPSIPQIRINLAAFLGHAGLPQDALRHLLDALRQDGSIPEVHNNMGVPAVSLAGDTSVSRAGRSTLHAAGLGDLAADTPDAFVRTAVALARNLDGLRALRLGMRDRLLASALMDHRGFARKLECAYRQMCGTPTREHDHGLLSSSSTFTRRADSAQASG